MTRDWRCSAGKALFDNYSLVVINVDITVIIVNITAIVVNIVIILINGSQPGTDGALWVKHRLILSVITPSLLVVIVVNIKVIVVNITVIVVNISHCCQGLTVLCGSSTVRLVSSGNFVNTVTVLVKVWGIIIINIQQSQNNVLKTIQ